MTSLGKPCGTSKHQSMNQLSPTKLNIPTMTGETVHPKATFGMRQAHGVYPSTAWRLAEKTDENHFREIRMKCISSITYSQCIFTYHQQYPLVT